MKPWRQTRSAIVVVALLAMALAHPIGSAGGAGQPDVAPLPARCTIFESLADDYAKVSAPGPHAILPQEHHVLTSSADGVPLDVLVVRPDVPPGQRVPVIVTASPYFGPFERIDARACAPHLTENYVPHGYAVALVSVRGTGGSGGCVDIFGPLERADLDQVVTWLGTRGWSNGAVGMTGLSYDGATAWEVAGAGNPYLKTIVPISGVVDIAAMAYRDGSTSTAAFAVPAVYWLIEPIQQGRDIGRLAESSACTTGVEGTIAAGASWATMESDPTGFWDARNLRPSAEERYEGSVLLVHGLQDWRVPPSQAFPWIERLEAKGLQVHYLLGQWDHAWPDAYWVHTEAPNPNARADWADIQLRWFDRWLKDDASVDLGPRVQVQDDAGAWRTEDAWPPSDARQSVLHLEPEGRLAQHATGARGVDVVGADPGRALWPLFWVNVQPPPEDPPTLAPCPACPRYETPPLRDDLRLVGRPVVELAVTPTGPASHVTAVLWAAGVDGARRVGWGQLDLRAAAGDGAAGTLAPDIEVVVRVALEPLDALVREGERLVLELTQASVMERMPSPAPAPILVRVGEGASTLSFLTIERAGEDQAHLPCRARDAAPSSAAGRPTAPPCGPRA